MKNKKSSKITKDELSGIQTVVDAINKIQMQVGGMEVQKQLAIKAINEQQQKLSVLQRTLEDKYGKVSVNLNDGTIKDIIDGESNTKN